jgi:hypothetical protein
VEADSYAWWRNEWWTESKKRQKEGEELNYGPSQAFAEV